MIVKVYFSGILDIDLDKLELSNTEGETILFETQSEKLEFIKNSEDDYFLQSLVKSILDCKDMDECPITVDCDED